MHISSYSLFIQQAQCIDIAVPVMCCLLYTLNVDGASCLTTTAGDNHPARRALCRQFQDWADSVSMETEKKWWAQRSRDEPASVQQVTARALLAFLSLFYQLQILSRTKPVQAGPSGGAAKEKRKKQKLPRLEDFLTARDYTGALTLLEVRLWRQRVR